MYHMNDLDNLYWLLRHEYDPARLIEWKRRIRAILNAPEPDYSVIRANFDSAMLLLPLPDDIETMEEAEAYFDAEIRRSYRNYGYDCTGQAFTTFHKIFRRRGRFFCYHGVAYDV